MSLQTRIRNAFADVLCPDENTLFNSDSEGADAIFDGRRWDEISVSDLHYHTIALLVFTAPAFIYYLPAYLIASLENRHSGFADAVVDRLCPPKCDPKRPSYQKWWSLLSREQRLCIIGFLEEFQADNPEHVGPVITSLRRHLEG